ncbi:hypothetical protein [Neobacillus niacini]|uniref:hypothetical protein n=1 Tax=Neobacillus niacini TaxID=86668 RepID=UPI002863E375|nr:hypothetical protein [Neobacillus niacini]MDR6999678.1 hypothetical protein [Neobacillus niacini]
MRKRGRLETFLVEPKYGSKGLVEPEAYAKFRNTGFFLECQRTWYSEKQMADKLGRYVNFYNSGVMASPFPHLLIITNQRYSIDGEYPFKIFRVKSFTQFNE